MIAVGSAAREAAPVWHRMHSVPPRPEPAPPEVPPPPGRPDSAPPEIDDPTPLENPVPVHEPPSHQPPAIACSKEPR